jgi:hypothetical protein
MHERFAQALQVQNFEGWKPFEEALEIGEGHKGGRAVGWAIFTEGDGAHRTAQVALTNRFDLQVGGERNCGHKKKSLNPRAPRAPEDGQVKTVGDKVEAARAG